MGVARCPYQAKAKAESGKGAARAGALGRIGVIIHPKSLENAVNHLLIIAHTPLASALRHATLHTYPELAQAISAYDVQPQDGREMCTQAILQALNLPPGELLVCSDVFGASPHFVAQAVVDARGGQLLTGVNLPMLMRACCYRELPLAQRAQKALDGGQQGIIKIEQ